MIPIYGVQKEKGLESETRRHALILAHRGNRGWQTRKQKRGGQKKKNYNKTNQYNQKEDGKLKIVPVYFVLSCANPMKVYPMGGGKGIPARSRKGKMEKRKIIQQK